MDVWLVLQVPAIAVRPVNMWSKFEPAHIYDHLITIASHYLPMASTPPALVLTCSSEPPSHTDTSLFAWDSHIFLLNNLHDCGFQWQVGGSLPMLLWVFFFFSLHSSSPAWETPESYSKSLHNEFIVDNLCLAICSWVRTPGWFVWWSMCLFPWLFLVFSKVFSYIKFKDVNTLPIQLFQSRFSLP